MHCSNYHTCSKGSAGILAVIVMMLIIVLGVGVYQGSLTELGLTETLQDGVAAQYMAENGAQRVMADLRNSEQLLTDINNLTIGGRKTVRPNSPRNVAVGTTQGSYTVTIVKNNDSQFTVSSVGIVNHAKRQVAFSVTVPVGNPLFDLAIYSRHPATLNGGGTVNGNLGSLQTVTQNGGTINGNVASATKYIHWGGTLTGTSTTIPQDLAVPATLPQYISFESSRYSSGTPLAGNLYDGTTRILSDPIYYVNGNLELSNQNTTLTVQSGRSVTIYAKGSIHLNWGSKINGSITLIAGSGEIELNGGSISAPGGKVNLYANGYVHNNSGSSISSSNIEVEAVSNIELNGGSTTVDDQGTVKMYTRSYFALNSNSVITGEGLVIASGNVGLNGGVGRHTMFISNGDSQVNSNSVSGPVYAVGTLEINGGTVTYDDDLAMHLGLSGGSGPLTFGNWNNH